MRKDNLHDCFENQFKLQVNLNFFLLQHFLLNFRIKIIRDVPLTITLSHISPVSKVIERLLSFVNSNTDPIHFRFRLCKPRIHFQTSVRKYLVAIWKAKNKVMHLQIVCQKIKIVLNIKIRLRSWAISPLACSLGSRIISRTQKGSVYILNS